jgi:DNA-binding MarR family transcriptional regulator
MASDQDFVRSLGLSFLAHRLKRASETILEGSAAALRRHGFASPARAGSTLLLLREQGPTAVTEIACRLRLSHPLIIKLTAAMAAAQLVRDEADPKDNRRRLIALTETGAAEAARFHAFARALGRTFEAMFAEAGADLFAALGRFEAAAEGRPIAARLEAALGDEPLFAKETVS